MGAEFQEMKGEFYKVKVEPTPFKFLPSKAPPRPPPPKGSRLFGSKS